MRCHPPPDGAGRRRSNHTARPRRGIRCARPYRERPRPRPPALGRYPTPLGTVRCEAYLTFAGSGSSRERSSNTLDVVTTTTPRSRPDRLHRPSDTPIRARMRPNTPRSRMELGCALLVRLWPEAGWPLIRDLAEPREWRTAPGRSCRRPAILRNSQSNRATTRYLATPTPRLPTSRRQTRVWAATRIHPPTATSRPRSEDRSLGCLEPVRVAGDLPRPDVLSGTAVCLLMNHHRPVIHAPASAADRHSLLTTRRNHLNDVATKVVQ